MGKRADRVKFLAGLIETEHWKGKKSLRAIERERGLSNGCLSSLASRHRLRVRSRSEQAALDFETGTRVPRRGADNWMFGQTKETSEFCRRSSERMKRRNPMRKKEWREKAHHTKLRRGVYERLAELHRGKEITLEQRRKIARTLSVHLAENVTEREIMMAAALADDARWVAQHPVNGCVVDFSIPSLLIAIEVDVGGHKLKRSASRDARLVKMGWTILRTRADGASSPRYFRRLLEVVQHFVPDIKIACKPPAAQSRYRVVVRSPEHPAGLQVDGPDDPKLRRCKPLV